MSSTGQFKAPSLLSCLELGSEEDDFLPLVQHGADLCSGAWKMILAHWALPACWVVCSLHSQKEPFGEGLLQGAVRLGDAFVSALPVALQ